MDLARGYSWTAIVLGLIVAAVGCGDAVRPPVTLTIDGETAVSDIYVWAHTSAFFKLRCTSRSEDAEALQTDLRPLLTAFGAAMSAGK